jgi:hypothetical protein
MDDYASELEGALAAALKLIDFYGLPLSTEERASLAPWWRLIATEKEPTEPTPS